MAGSSEQPIDWTQRSNDMIEDFFNFNDPPRHDYREKKKVSSYRVSAIPNKPTQKMQRGQKGLDYVAANKESIDEELTKKFSRMNLTNMTCISTLDVSITTARTTASFLDENFGRSHRRDLPIFNSRELIIQTINESPVTLVSGQTGSGKSTQVAQYIYDYNKLNKKQCKVVICQPRKIAAITIAQRVADDRGVVLGGEVGYQISLKREHNVDPDCPTGLLFCTTGVLLQQFVFEKSMSKYTHVFLDEVHEREVDTDFLLILIRTMLAQTPNIKIVLLSATMDTQKFRDYFKVTLDDGTFLPPVVDLTSVPRTHPVTEYFIEDILKVWPDVMIGNGKLFDYAEPGITDNLYDMAASLILICLRSHAVCNNDIARKPPSILVFLPGLQEIESLHARLSKPENSKQMNNIGLNPELCVLHSTLSTEEQKNSFVTSGNPKIILSTNIAESGVTIPNVTHVIDFCLTKYQTTASGAQISALVVNWASKNNCKQRSGRAGRVCKGTVFRLVDRSFYTKNMPEYPPPEMQRVGLETVVLKIKVLDMGSPLQMLAQAMDPPDMSKIIDAVLHLKELGALTRLDETGNFCYEDGDLTFLGRITAALPIDVRISKLIVLGYLFSVLDEAIIIGAGLNLKSIFAHSYDRKIDGYVQKLDWADGTESDCLAILNAFKVWHQNKYFDRRQQSKGEPLWCKRHFLDMKNLQEMKLMIDEIKRRLEDHRIAPLEHDQPVWEPRDKTFILKVILAGAFGPANFFVQPEDLFDSQREAFKTVKNKDLFSTVYFKNMNRELVGEVYESQLRQILLDKGVVTDKSIVNFEFDFKTSEKIYLTFENDRESTDDYNDKKIIGKIMPEVYRCVKLRQLDNKIALDTMSIVDTMKYAGENGLGVFGNEIGISFEPHKNFIKHPEWCVEPTTLTSKMHGYVTHVSNDGKFFFRPVKAFYESYNETDESYRKVFNEIQEKISTAALTSLKEIEFKLEDGQFVVIDTEKSLERGRLMSKNKLNGEVYLIDRGHRITLPIEDIFVPIDTKTEKDLLEYPPRIFECVLTEVQPSSVLSREGKWTEKAIKEFRTVIDRKVTIRIYSVVNGVASVQLNTSKEHWNLNFVKEGFAEDSEESYMSKHNHEFRTRSQRQKLSIKPIKPAEEFREVIDKTQKKLIPSPPQPKCHIKQKLLGPYSPLEMDLCGLSRLNKGRASVEVGSVNSVLLNESILRFRDKFCVAADVTVNPKTFKVTLRETTMMPSIPGLSVILSLIFSPNAELRRDENKYRYLSVITGLGYDAERDQPLYGERDAALNIDFELTEKDLDMINELRFAMSHMLLTDPENFFPDMVQSQKAAKLRQIQSLVLKIFDKRRPPLEVSQPDLVYNWNVDQDELVPSFNPHGARGLYNTIRYSKLHEMPADHKMGLLQHAEELKRCASNMIFMQSKICKLCNVSWDSTPELELHLFSKRHINRVNELSK